MALHEKLALLSIRLSKAFDQAAMYVAYGEAAALNYNQRYSSFEGLLNWASGFRAGWNRENEAAGNPVETCAKAVVQSHSAPSYGSDQVNR